MEGNNLVVVDGTLNTHILEEEYSSLAEADNSLVGAEDNIVVELLHLVASDTEPVAGLGQPVHVWLVRVVVHVELVHCERVELEVVVPDWAHGMVHDEELADALSAAL